MWLEHNQAFADVSVCPNDEAATIMTLNIPDEDFDEIDLEWLVEDMAGMNWYSQNAGSTSLD